MAGASRRRIRELLFTMFDEESIMEIGRSRAPEIYAELSEARDLNDKIRLLFEFFERDGRLEELHAAITGKGKRDSARLNPDFRVETPEDLSPPIVHDPIHECARSVLVDSFAPGALVQVYSNGAEVVGTATPHFGFVEMALTRSMVVGEIITATQTIGGIESAQSHAPVEVVPLPKFPTGLPPAPNVNPPIFACGRIVPVASLIPGVRVIVSEDGADIGVANAAGEWKAVITTPLTEGAEVQARQVTCDDIPGRPALEGPPSVGEHVLPVPDPFEGPNVEQETVVVGNDSVTINGLYVGALVTVFNGGTVIGSGFANGARNWVPLALPIEATWSVTATQELCGTSESSDPVTPSTELRAPKIVGPVCDTDTTVRVRGSILNATVLLLRDGDVAGVAGAQLGDFLMATGEHFNAGDALTVLQYMGPTTSPESDPVQVCACSDRFLTPLLEEILGGADPALLPVTCAPSTVPILTNPDPFDVIELTLRADFAAINQEPGEADAVSDGTIIYIDAATGLPVEVDCRIEARGNTRFDYCGWRPLTLRFNGDPNGTIFEGTGMLIKIITHCGFKPGDQWILGGTIAQHDRRLLQEFTLYQVLGAMETAALDTRLAMITYQDLTGADLETRYGIVREREGRAAQRCGFERLEEDEGDGNLPPNPTSDFQVRFHHQFLFSHDFHPSGEHNVVRMGSPSGEEHYMPYDFDLSGVIRPDYFKNNNWTIEQNGEALIDWLTNTADQDLVRVQIAALLQHEAAMRERSVGGPVDTIGRVRLRHWFDDHIRRLKCYLN